MQTCDFRGISERTASFSRPDVFTEIKCVDPINLNGHWFCNWLKFAGMLALCCIHGFIVRQQKTECHCVQTDASRLLLSVFLPSVS